MATEMHWIYWFFGIRTRYTVCVFVSRETLSVWILAVDTEALKVSVGLVS